MRWFRRSDTGDKVPAELEPYYENRGGWRLWVRRIVALVVLLALLFLLAWGVRGLYNRVTGDDADQGKTNKQLTEQKRDRDNKDDKQAEKDTGTSTNGAENKPSDDNQTASNSDSSSQDNQNQTSGSAATNQDNQTAGSGQATVPASGDASGNTAATGTEPLPNTGPEDVISSVLAASLIGAIFHRLVLVRARR